MLQPDQGGVVSVETNVRMIERLFAAFRDGDVESILAALADDVD